MAQSKDNSGDGGLMDTIREYLPSGRKVAMWFGTLALLSFAVLSKGLIEMKEPDEILVVQSVGTGDLTWYTGTEAWVWQFWGQTTTYKKRDIYSFDNWIESKDPKTPGRCPNGIDVRFNDGGHGTICGSIQFEMPMDEESLTKIHTKFKGQAAVKSALIETITGKSVYLAGPLMSSRESYAEKRNNLLHYIDDQIQHGVYKTVQIEKHVKDAITGQDKTATVVELVLDKSGKPERQEPAVLEQFGIKSFNFAIKRMPYDEKVEAQIQEQQKITMEVQTSMADAKKAEQRTITVTEQGKASAAEAKWKQEAIKATEVTKAEQSLAVATLGAKTAEQTKREQILLGEGEAERKRLVMNADGALTPKLEAWLKAQQSYAEAIKGSQQALVPTVVMGGSSQGGANSVQDILQMIGVKTARELSLDMSLPSGRKSDKK